MPSLHFHPRGQFLAIGVPRPQPGIAEHLMPIPLQRNILAGEHWRQVASHRHLKRQGPGVCKRRALEQRKTLLKSAALVDVPLD